MVGHAIHQTENIRKGIGDLQMVGIINLALYFIEFEMASWGTK